MKKSRLVRKSPLRRTRWGAVQRRTAVEVGLRASLALAFHDAAQKPWCHACHTPRTAPLHAHHWVEHSFLRTELRNVLDPLRLAAICFDVRNQSGLCELCHLSHHGPSGQSPLTRQHVPESAFEFAKELDSLVGDERFTVRLERYREEA